LGREGSGLVEPIRAKPRSQRVGLGTEQAEEDPRFKILPGDSYRVIMQKKAQQRFARYNENKPAGFE